MSDIEEYIRILIEENTSNKKEQAIEHILAKLNEESILKQKIKDKIKELEENKSDDNISGSDLSVEEFNNEVINILKEIIE